MKLEWTLPHLGRRIRISNVTRYCHNFESTTFNLTLEWPYFHLCFCITLIVQYQATCTMFREFDRTVRKPTQNFCRRSISSVRESPSSPYSPWRTSDADDFVRNKAHVGLWESFLRGPGYIYALHRTLDILWCYPGKERKIGPSSSSNLALMTLVPSQRLMRCDLNFANFMISL